MAAAHRRQDRRPSEEGSRAAARAAGPACGAEWFVELGIGDGRPPVEVHVGGCYAAGKRRRPVGRDEARRLLASGVRACSHCQPDTALDILDLPTRPALTATAR
ncbi:DUF6233 domain-containing protein [Streptomyces phaeochromogenes]